MAANGGNESSAKSHCSAARGFRTTTMCWASFRFLLAAALRKDRSDRSSCISGDASGKSLSCGGGDGGW